MVPAEAAFRRSVLTSGAASEWLARVPPPYRLTCDLAIVPVVLSAAAARELAGVPVRAAAGRTVGVLLAARYTGARYGPDAATYPAPPGDFYSEVSLALPVKDSPWPAFVFARMWVDSEDQAPIALGHAYGFPKEAAAVAWERSSSGLTVGVSSGSKRSLALDASVGPALPGGWLAAVAGIWAIFPATGLRAPMRLEDTGRAALLRVRNLAAPGLVQQGVSLRPLAGLFLSGCTVALGGPQPLA